jgi:E-phenylitaconyl-CoA hydratase
MSAELTEAFIRLEQDDDIRVAIFIGAGDRAFCTGSDLKKTIPGVGVNLTGAAVAFNNSAGFFRDLPKPIIAAVNGYALGGGCELALRCDIRICSENARFGLTEVRVGSIPGAGGTQRLPRIVGLSNALHMLFTGDHADAEAALRMGLVSKVVAPEKLLEEATEIAMRIQANAPLSVRAIKKVVYGGIDMPLREALDHERLAFAALFNSEDRIEGRKAFAEKRRPQYRGR